MCRMRVIIIIPSSWCRGANNVKSVKFWEQCVAHCRYFINPMISTIKKNKMKVSRISPQGPGPGKAEPQTHKTTIKAETAPFLLVFSYAFLLAPLCFLLAPVGILGFESLTQDWLAGDSSKTSILTCPHENKPRSLFISWVDTVFSEALLNFSLEGFRSWLEYGLKRNMQGLLWVFELENPNGTEEKWLRRALEHLIHLRLPLLPGFIK